MFFTSAGKVVAWFCVVGGLAHWGYLTVFSTQIANPPSLHDPMWQKIFASANKDYKLIAFGICLGIFAEISRSIAALAAAKNAAPESSPRKSDEA